MQKKKIEMDEIKDNNFSKVFMFIVLAGILIRMIHISQPLLEGASTRQVETAMIARNFYHYGFNLFYPQVDIFGNNPGYLMQEFYIIPFIAALFYKILGGVHEEVLRLISLFSYVLAVFMIYRLASYFYNRKVGMISAFCFTFSPLSIYLGRAVHPEMLMIFFIMATIYLFTRWVDEEKVKYGVLAALCFVMAVLLKVPNLYLLLPLFFIAFLKYRWDFIKRKGLWFFLIGAFIPIILFNYHQHLVRTEFPNPAMENFNIGNMIYYIKIYLTGKVFYKTSYENLAGYTLTPIGFTLFALALMLRVKEKREWLFHYWILAVAVFFLAIPAQSIQGYYQMHLLAPASIMIGKLVSELQSSEFYRDRLIKKRYFLTLLIFLVLGIVFRYSYAYYKTPDNFKYVVETGDAVKEVTEKDALVIASIENGPDLVYYAARKGWFFMINRESLKEEEKRSGENTGKIYDRIKYLEHLRKEGAQYFASASLKEFYGHERFSKYMLDHYRIAKKTSHFVIFDIKKQVK